MKDNTRAIIERMVLNSMMEKKLNNRNMLRIGFIGIKNVSSEILCDMYEQYSGQTINQMYR